MRRHIKIFFSAFVLTLLVTTAGIKKDWLKPLTGASKSLTQNREELILRVREGLLEGKEKVVIKCIGTSEEVETFVKEAPEKAFLIDDLENSSDYDYLRYKYKGMSANLRGLGAAHVITYEFNYLESREETDKVNQEVNRVLKELSIFGKSDYQKVKLIHDFIVTHITYDISTYKNSAYEALINQRSACQGYASLTYKMLLEAGVECRIIGGNAMNEPHAWNIVKLNDLWYNLDCTWDDPVGNLDKDYISYDYFLKGERDFLDHTRDKNYDTKEFHKDHKMAETEYIDKMK